MKADAASRRSLGHAVAKTLRERIAGERLEPGDRLPSEPELARVLGISRPSLREGIALLEEDGVRPSPTRLGYLRGPPIRRPE